MQHCHHDTLTYRFPRNTIDAFGTDATSACAVERHVFRTHLLVRWLLRVTVLGLVLGAVVWGLV